MVSREAKIALISFIGSSTVFLAISFFNICFKISSLLNNIVILSITALLTCLLLKLIYRNYDFEIAIRASFLGTVFAIGIYVKFSTLPNIGIFGLYMCIMSVFHYTEFLTLALIDPKLVSPKSFVINHSPEYTFAAVFSWIEFFTETYFWPNLKEHSLISILGCVICIGGELLRKAAMFNAGTNFNHLVQYKRAKDHVLVTTGVYSWFRHPSYVGWFYWSIGTQIVLLNPISIVGYAIASWMFFKQRIFIEELTLLNFFGQEYCDYQKDVGTGIPFIEGYLIRVS